MYPLYLDPSGLSHVLSIRINLKIELEEIRSDRLMRRFVYLFFETLKTVYPPPPHKHTHTNKPDEFPFHFRD